MKPNRQTKQDSSSGNANELRLQFPSRSQNELLARMTVAAFLLPLDPLVEELTDIKTAVSEAVTNCIVHAYPDTIGKIWLTAVLSGRKLTVTVRDAGVGIANLEKAMQPMFTTAPEDERAGLGFAVMESFSDRLRVRSHPGKGTVVRMEKTLSLRP